MTRRYTAYTQDIADLICERLVDGESLRAICQDENLPHRKTVVRWKNTNPEFREQYRVAREDQAELWADEIMDIADEYVPHEYINQSRLRVDTRKWMLSKLKPGTYGDKIQHANAAGDGNTEVIYRWAESDEK